MAGNIAGPAQDDGPRDARVQARRAEERPGGKGGKVKSRRQAIAIALKEAGDSKYESKSENKRNLAKSKRKEASGKTYQQEREGKSHVGARGKRESTRDGRQERKTADAPDSPSSALPPSATSARPRPRAPRGVKIAHILPARSGGSGAPQGQRVPGPQQLRPMTLRVAVRTARTEQRAGRKINATKSVTPAPGRTASARAGCRAS